MTSDSDQLENVSRRKFIVGVGAAGLAGLAGCSGDDDTDTPTEGGNGNGDMTDTDTPTDTPTDTEIQPGDLSGDLRVSGSSTVFPVAQEVGRKFAADDGGIHPDVSFNLSKDGSGGGFRNVFIPGDSDINNASRPIKDEELQSCQDNGINPIEFQIAQDALTIVVNNNADFIDSISIETLGQIWSPDSKPAKWSDVKSSWPDQEFDLYGAATTSGTFDYFTERVVGEEGSIREDYEGTERDDQIAQGVASSEAGLGYLPFAYYTNNPDQVKALSIVEGDSDPVEPSLSAAQSGEYPLARPLFFYVNNNHLADEVTLQEFCKFYIEEAGKDYIANEIGYVPSSDTRVQDNLTKLNNKISELT